ncbi:MAG: hypothetical protein AVDCRST_MAG83-1681 [uncultured Arthrobacter sp.]|uniref:Uncharacterized protein n=1 Tax=uncultured Arthrobacter sp. TaxID=114050 RepID=A0A6J4I5T6_9MICC|nr:hypothetical protein [uncultured Arthrobacter sp.]CAA9241941.1 MAG: hypothetical protein AVDCRST_MAG83-1681 [uncultured Arthrobacter sp.]
MATYVTLCVVLILAALFLGMFFAPDRERLFFGFFAATWTIGVLFWVTVFYVAWHFLSRWW